MEKCEICNQEAELKNCKIKDNMGTMYRKICCTCASLLSEKGYVKILDKEDAKTQITEVVSFEDAENVLLTTGPDFSGYKILEYKGIVFDETISGVGIKTAFKGIEDIFASLTGDQLYSITERINELKAQQLEKLKIKAARKGANAIIAVDIECTVLSGSSIMVSANGTAVIIEKE